MKKFRQLAALVVVLLCSITSYAQSVEVNGIYYYLYEKWNGEKNEYVASVTNDGSANYNCYSGDVVIPETVTHNDRTYTVTAIGHEAFKSCPNLASISIPNTINSMESYCFQYCISLTSISLPTGITSIEYGCFEGCKQLTDIAIPNSVKSIKGSAFLDCRALREISLPNQLTSIGETAFHRCYSLESVNIPSSVTTLGWAAFQECNNLVNATISGNVTALPNQVFNSCPKLTSISLPSTITNIGDNAFSGCNSLERINLPESLKIIGNYAFDNCPLLSATIPLSATSIGEQAFTAGTITLDATDPSWLTISKGSHPFGYGGMGGLKIVVADNAYEAYIASENWSMYKSNIYATSEIPRYTHLDENGVTWSYRYVYATKSLSITNAIGYTTSLVFPAALPYGDGTLTVGGVEFGISNNDVITSVDLSATSIKRITRYGDAMGVSDVYFDNCPSLQTVKLPSTLEELGYYSFYNCPSLETINWSNLTSLKTIGQQVFYDDWNNQNTLIKSIDLSSTIVETIGDEAFYRVKGLEEILFPTTLKEIGRSAFNNLEHLKNIDLSNTQVAELGNNTFAGCYNLQLVSLPASLKKIGSEAFAHSNNISINLSNVEIIGDRAFNNCYLFNIDLSSAKEIGIQAFTADLNVTINSSTPATIKANSFTDNTKFIVTPDAYDAFCNAPVWSKWASNISMYNIDDDGVKWIYRYLKDTNSMCITSVSGYGQNVTVPTYVSYNNTNVPVTHLENAFNSADITSVTLPATLTTIGNHAFSYSKLPIIEIPASVTSIGYGAFQNCYDLTSVTFAPNSALQTIGDFAFASNEYNYDGNSESKLTFIELPATVTSIGNGAFQYCRKLKNVTLAANSQLNSIGSEAFRGCYNITDFDLSKVQTIGSYAFYGANLTSVDISSALSIGNNAFGGYAGGEPLFTINNVTPATIESEAFSSNSIFLVPGTAVNTYKSANIWSNYASRILASNIAIQNLTLTAKTDRSDLEVQIGDANLLSVVDLTIKGSINSYDFMVMRNKMPFLRRLNLSEANIVGNDYKHYEHYNTEDNKFPGYGLYNCKLVSLELPQTITEIGYHALANVPNLKNIVIPDGVTNIDGYAFMGCSNLRTISIPESLTRIGSYIFNSCSNLESINIPKGVTEIPSGAFQSCSSLKSIVLPPTIESIGWGAFSGCYSLKELRIPSSVRRIENDAFGGTNIDDVYVYVVEPFNINQQTFAMNGNNFIGTLHAPKVSYWNYFYDTQWSQFLNFAEFDEPYENFYLEGDKILDEETGEIRGEEGNAPDAELGSGSGLKVEDDITQDLGDVEIKHDGENGGSIIVDGSGEVNTENLTFHINVQGGRWYFFCFPFDVRRDDIVLENGAEWIFRYYDGEERAKNGQGGWKNVTSDGNGNFLKAATGYIFQCSKDDVLTLSAKNAKIKKEDKYNELVEHIAQNAHDASWNFVGNPYLSYYEITSSDYSAPITVWDGSNYIAIRPGDDDYQLAPFEAFFVQKPEGTDAVNYDSDNQMTRTEAGEVAAAARVARSRQAINPNRLLINITLSNGKQTDKTRVVFNNEADMKYEAECDAAKFSAAGVPQLYTLDAKAVKYAINERPVAQGNVTLGYTAPVEGQYVLEAPRMDTPMLLMDNVTGTVHDFTDGAYEFTAEAGSYDARFTLIINGNATGIEGVDGNEYEGPIYNIKGQQVKDMKENGVYIKNNRKVISK